MKYQIEANCVCGNFRANNEDAIAFGEHQAGQFAWLAIADGMGGHQAGEVASHLLVDMARQAMQSIEYKSLRKKADWLGWIEALLVDINQCIYQQAQRSSEQQGMGTTGVILICRKAKYYLGWVGDSRAYVLRNAQLAQLTKDHSAIQMLLDKGAITEQEAQRSNTKHLLARAIGVKAEVEVDVSGGKVHVDDVFFVSTDGVHDVVEAAELERFLVRFNSGKNISKSLTNRALKLGSKDNISFALLKLKN